LLSHPVYTLTDPWKHIHLILAPEDLPSYAPEQYKPFLGRLFNIIVYPSLLWLVLILALITVAMTIRNKAWKNSPAFWLIMGALVLFIPHFYLVWHGDSAEVGRHAVQASMQLRLALWLLLFLALDKIVSNEY